MEPMDCIVEFNNIVKNVIAPGFKEIGFKSKGLDFYRRTNDIIQVFSIQKDRGSSSDQIGFHFELGLLNEEIFSEFNEFEMPKIPRAAFCTIRLTPKGVSGKCQSNYTLSIFRDIPVIQVSSQIEIEIEKWLLPFYEKYNSTNSWGELLDLNIKGLMILPSIQRFRVYLKIGRPEQAAIELRKSHSFSLKEYSKALQFYQGRLKGKRLDNKTKIWTDSLKEIEALAAKYNITID